MMVCHVAVLMHAEGRRSTCNPPRFTPHCESRGAWRGTTRLFSEWLGQPIRRNSVPLPRRAVICVRKADLAAMKTRRYTHPNFIHSQDTVRVTCVFNYTCDLCDYKTKRSNHLRRHKASSVHSSPKGDSMKTDKRSGGGVWHECELCDYKTKRSDHLRRHKASSVHSSPKGDSMKTNDVFLPNKRRLGNDGNLWTLANACEDDEDPILFELRGNITDLGTVCLSEGNVKMKGRTNFLGKIPLRDYVSKQHVCFSCTRGQLFVKSMSGTNSVGIKHSSVGVNVELERGVEMRIYPGDKVYLLHERKDSPFYTVTQAGSGSSMRRVTFGPAIVHYFHDLVHYLVV